ncbi:MFS transporter [Planctomonas sp. JC2975]|uniref:MFS transporter n=1 Tax=Planctomonas sp. JC2975 TaxID=2729626 RepID=UPI003211E350
MTTAEGPASESGFVTPAASAYRGATVKLLLLAAAMFMVGTNASIIAGLLPEIAHGLKATQSTVSYSITVYSVVVAIVAPVASIVLVRMPRAVLMSIGAVFFSAGTLVASLSTSATGFVGGRAIAALGGAALVPTAGAVAATLVPPERRGRALALVSLGFTLSSVLGAPIGTALGSLASWRLPMLCLAGLGIIVGIGIGIFLRGVPTPPVTPLRHRLAPLADRRVLGGIGTTLFIVVAFNVVFIFSASLTADATGGSGVLLAALLMTNGLAGIVGNFFAGRFTDRFGSRYVAVIALSVIIVLLAVMPLALGSLVACLVVFLIWGLVSAGTSVPVQYRLIAIDPDDAVVTLSWNSTAMYVGIALSPPLGNLAIGIGGVHLTPVVGAVCAALALCSFLIGTLPVRERGRRRRPEATRQVAKAARTARRAESDSLASNAIASNATGSNPTAQGLTAPTTAGCEH